MEQRFICWLSSRAYPYARIGEINHTSLTQGLLMVAAWGPETDTFIHLVPIKDQSSRLFNAFCLMGGNRFKSALERRANVCSVVNLTHATEGVQVLA
jgi:hypothetical protein